MFKKVLIANRGEIACRVAQTCQELGVAAVAVFSDADRTSRHVMMADEAHHLEGVTPGETYLDHHKIIEAARFHGADAIHPGYGFLSENAEFARACAAAGITFVGPQPEVISAMGDKIIAKKTLSEAGVPVVPGWTAEGDVTAGDLQREAERIGYPVLLKAAAGGGGKGMRIVREQRELGAALEAAQREANSAFGDARVFLEKYVERPRHVEVQIFGDAHGNCVHLFERECSVQRRYQKIVEEAPSPALTPELRAEMGAAAVRAAQALNYTNAGTVEFILSQDGSFYFLEVNTRLQVEHPVTELTVLHDLVALQLAVAAGERLPFSQSDLRQHGHAIECRIYAEDPQQNFVPSTGMITAFSPPFGSNIRVDTGVMDGTEVTVHYDPMLAKLIVWGTDRPAALRRMAWALRRFVVLGVTTNIEFLHELITHPEFVAGDLHTHFLQEHEITGDVGPPTDEALIAGTFALALSGMRSAPASETGPAAAKKQAGPWAGRERWRNV